MLYNQQTILRAKNTFTFCKGETPFNALVFVRTRFVETGIELRNISFPLLGYGKIIMFENSRRATNKPNLFHFFGKQRSQVPVGIDVYIFRTNSGFGETAPFLVLVGAAM